MSEAQELSTVQWVTKIVGGDKRMSLIHASLDGGHTLCNRQIPSGAFNECPLFDSSLHSVNCRFCSRKVTSFGINKSE